MRNIRWYIVGIGSALLWGNLAFAQQAPPVQVIVGPTGIKVIDPKTGKELPCVVTKVANAQPRIQIELDKPGVVELDVQLDAAHKELLRAIMAQKAAEHARKLQIQQIELKLIPGPDGKAVVVAAQPGRPGEPAAGMSMDRKIDLLLKQVGELRRDVEDIKRKLDGKPGGPFFEWKLSPKDKDGIRIQFGPGPEKKEEKGKQSGPNYEKKEEKGKKEGGKGQKDGDRDRDLERRFERILQEAEELRREIRKMKGRDKD
jgi:hypothetical protein